MDPDRPVVRWSLIVLWALVGCMLYAPVAAFFGWPLLIAAFAGGVIWTGQDFLTLGHQTEPIQAGRTAIRLELALVIAVCIAIVWFATTHSLVSQARDVFALSPTAAPLFTTFALLAAMSALRDPTPRRIAVASMVTLGVMPVLAAIRLGNIPVFGFYREFEPWIIAMFSACTMLLGALGIHLGVVARRVGYGDDVPPDLPRALALAPRQ